MFRSPCLHVWPGHQLQERTRPVPVSRRDRTPAAVFDRSLLSPAPVVPGQEGPSVQGYRKRWTGFETAIT